MDGKVGYAQNVSVTLDVFMDHVRNHGSAFAMKVGVDFSVIRI